MPFLIAKDFAKQIQSDNLSQVTGGDTSISLAAQLTAIEEVTSFLVQKYDLTNEFQPLAQWDPTVVYKATNRVYVDAAVYNSGTAYTVGQYTVFTGNFYICTGNTTPGVFDPTKWTLIAPQYQIFYAAFPFQLFTYDTQYALGDKVWWKDSVYTCLIASQLLGQNTALQYGSYQNLPLLNVSPDNVNNGAQFWGSGTPYTVPASTAITDVKWTKGDNRSQQLVTYLVDITLYHLHSRIAPRNIPDLRVKRYDDACKWLKAVSRGEVTANLPLLAPKQGARIRFGGNIKNVNAY